MEDKRSIPTAGNACAEWHVLDDRLAQADAHMPDEDTLYDLAELYKMFGDSTRIKILYALVDTELCVCDIAQVLTMSVSAISHQLRVLKQARLVKYRREGKTVFYSLADDHVHEILALGLEHINE